MTNSTKAKDENMYTRGLLVAIEGIDGSGKGSLTQEVIRQFAAKNVVQQGLVAASTSFPNYQGTRYGSIVGRYLNGELGQQLHPLIHGTLYALDRFEFRDKLMELLIHNNIVLCDRYILSNICYSWVMASEAERQSVVDHLWWLEYELFKMPQPDLTVIMDMPPHQAVRNVAAKKRRDYTTLSADILENDVALMFKASEYYRDVRSTPTRHTSLKRNGSVRRLQCMDEPTGQMRPISELAGIVVSLIEEAVEYAPFLARIR